MMEGSDSKKGLKLFIPPPTATNNTDYKTEVGNYNNNNTSTTSSIRREPNLKLQFRPATPVHTAGKSFLNARPSTPSGLKKVNSCPLSSGGYTIFPESNQEEMAAEDINKVRMLKREMSLDINQNHINIGSITVKERSKSCIRRERNTKLLQRQNTPVCCGDMMRDDGFFGGFPASFMHSEKHSKTPPSPLTITRDFVQTSSPLARKISRPLSPLVRQSAVTSDDTTGDQIKQIPVIQLSSDSGIEDLPVYDDDDEDRLWIRNDIDNDIDEDKQLKLKRSLTINIPREYQSVEDIDALDLLGGGRPRSKSCYIRREPNLKVVYRLQTPKTTDFPLDFEQRAKAEHSDTATSHATKEHPLLRNNRVNKNLMIDIPALYEEKNSTKGIVRREKNLKIFHRQDTPLSLFGNESTFHFHPEGTVESLVNVSMQATKSESKEKTNYTNRGVFL